jgi:maleylacetoacetate isomerase
MKLYSYFRSSAAYRVRIALGLKDMAFELAPVNLAKGEHRGEVYRTINPQGLVPSLETDDGRVITQSSAILEWLEDTYDDTPLYPADPYERAVVRGTVNTIACDIHPLNNLRVLKYLVAELGVGEEDRISWYWHWIRLGFASLEQQLQASPFCYGDNPTMADVYLVPQVFNALRFSQDMSAFPKINSIYAACNDLDAFISAAPENQPDAP